MPRFIRKHNRNKAVALLLTLALILTIALGTTLAYLVVKTPSLFNTFLSGLDPTGDLLIRKVVEHPYGDNYRIPADLTFTFRVDLGESYAGKTIATSQGDKTANDKGQITVTVGPGEAVRIKEILLDTVVTVTELEKKGFTPDGENPRAVTIVRGEVEVSYTNTYVPGPVDPVNLEVTGTKILEGRDWQVGDTFTFLLELKDMSGEEPKWQELGKATVTYELVEQTDPNDPTKTILVPKPDFDKFSFTDLVKTVDFSKPGEYAFRISEVAGSIGGVTYDQVVSYFDVIVGDKDMDGALEIQEVIAYQNATHTYDETTKTHKVDVTVNNQYAPAGSAKVKIQIDKTVTSHSGEEKSLSGYIFQLFDEDGNLLVTSPATTSAGEVLMELTYEAKDAGKTFHYILKEMKGDAPGVTYDETEYKITVVVIDNLDGTIRAEISGLPNEDGNQSWPEIPVETVPGETEPEETEPVERTPGETEPAETQPEETEPINNIPITLPGNPVTGTTNPDTNPEPQQPTTPETQPEETPAEDEPPAKNEGSNVYNATFENIYDPTDTRLKFEGTKVLTGRTLKAEEFTFDLYATDHTFTVTEEMKPIQSVANTLEGAVVFQYIS